MSLSLQCKIIAITHLFKTPHPSLPTIPWVLNVPRNILQHKLQNDLPRQLPFRHKMRFRMIHNLRLPASPSQLQRQIFQDDGIIRTDEVHRRRLDFRTVKRAVAWMAEEETTAEDGEFEGGWDVLGIG